MNQLSTAADVWQRHHTIPTSARPYSTAFLYLAGTIEVLPILVEADAAYDARHAAGAVTTWVSVGLAVAEPACCIE